MHKKQMKTISMQKQKTTKNLRQRSTLSKLLKILKKINNHPFAAQLLNDTTNTTNDDTMCKFIARVNEHQYQNVQQVFEGVMSMLENRKQARLHTEEFNKEEINLMINILRRKFIQCYEKVFETTESQERIIETSSITKIKIPNSTYDVTISLNYSLPSSEMNTDKIKLYKYFPNTTHDFSQENSKHAYIAGYQFHKMMSDLPYNTVPLRKIPNVSNAIQSITYVENENLQREYENQKLTFKYQGKVDRSGNVEELLLFHGTTWSCVKEIINNNFDANAVPQQLTTSNKQRAKSMFFGKGVYLSAIPALSLIYGNALILCKVLPGLSEMLSLPRTQPPPLDEAHDSREVTLEGKTSVIHMIPKASQILPYCIIQLKNQSLISEFTKPPSRTLVKPSSSTGQ